MNMKKLVLPAAAIIAALSLAACNDKNTDSAPQTSEAAPAATTAPAADDNGTTDMTTAPATDANSNNMSTGNE